MFLSERGWNGIGLEDEGRKKEKREGGRGIFACSLVFCNSSIAFLLTAFACFSIFENKVMADMEAQVHKLREELINVNSQRKQQLVELGLLREEEKQRAARDHETAVNKLKAESEKMKIELKKTHAAETEMTLEKVRHVARFFVDSRNPYLKPSFATPV